MKTKCIYFFASLFISILASCSTYSDPQMYSTFEPRVIAVETGETYVLRVQGKGLTREDAVNNAIIQAIKDVIFKDIQVTYGDHRTLTRIINDPRIEEQHPEFFNEFFSSRGLYKRFISPVKNNREYFKSSDFQKVIMNVKVDRGRLKSYLAENSLIK